MISIIIPTLNEGTTIEATLKRLRSIWFADIEIIVSDGQSQDDTIRIAKQLANQVVVYSGQERQTIAHARNLGAQVAKGEFLMFLDSDVLLSDADGVISRILGEFEKDKNLVAVTTRLKVLPENETLIDSFCSTVFIDWPHYLNNNILKIGSSSGEFQFIKKSAFESLGGFDEKLVSCEDINMFERLAKIGKTRMLYDLTVYHSGRRFHKVGWLKVLSTWFVNIIYYKFFGHVKSKEWTVVR